MTNIVQYATPPCPLPPCPGRPGRSPRRTGCGHKLRNPLLLLLLLLFKHCLHKSILNRLLSVYQQALLRLLEIGKRLARTVLVELLAPLFRKAPLRRELGLVLEVVMSHIQGDIIEFVIAVPGRSNKVFYQVLQVSLVLRLVLEALAAHLDHLRFGVVAYSSQLLEFLFCPPWHPHVLRGEFHNHLFLSWVKLAHLAVRHGGNVILVELGVLVRIRLGVVLVEPQGLSVQPRRPFELAHLVIQILVLAGIAPKREFDVLVDSGEAIDLGQLIKLLETVRGGAIRKCLLQPFKLGRTIHVWLVVVFLLRLVRPACSRSGEGTAGNWVLPGSLLHPCELGQPRSLAASQPAKTRCTGSRRHDVCVELGDANSCYTRLRKDFEMLEILDLAMFSSTAEVYPDPSATVGFRTLTEEVLQPAFWRFLRSKKYTALRIQCGPDITWASEKLKQLEHEIPAGLDVDVFEIRKNLMREEMVLCKAADGLRAAGLVISHAGTGTILDAWKLGLSIIVVPNKQLLDDHQTEMAKHLAKEGYATMSSGRQVSPETSGGSC
ncbi:glycosyltransferase family 1 protein [Paramyrothecium foliicola]|nr:glycosyltransferase family 1 protein [Paramyrothecium foliicola]